MGLRARRRSGFGGRITTAPATVNATSRHARTVVVGRANLDDRGPECFQQADPPMPAPTIPPASSFLVAAVAAALLALACQPAGPGDGTEVGSPAGPIQVAVAVPPQAYFVERIGRDRVAVTVMVPAGAAPDSYEPTPQQVLALDRARLYVKVGLAGFPFEERYLEGPAGADSGEGRDLEVIDMSRGLAPLREAGGDELGETDPHVWTSPAAARVAAEHIADALARLDPAGADLYRANLAAFLTDVDALDREIHGELDGLPHRRFLVVHPAWGYFARDYGLEQVAIESGGKEPSPTRLAALIEEARREGVRTVFVQRGFSDRAARVLAQELGAEVVALDPLAHDWLNNLRTVARELHRALIGSPPRSPDPSPTS